MEIQASVVHVLQITLGLVVIDTRLVCGCHGYTIEEVVCRHWDWDTSVAVLLHLWDLLKAERLVLWVSLVLLKCESNVVITSRLKWQSTGNKADIVVFSQSAWITAVCPGWVQFPSKYLKTVRGLCKSKSDCLHARLSPSTVTGALFPGTAAPCEEFGLDIRGVSSLLTTQGLTHVQGYTQIFVVIIGPERLSVVVVVDQQNK